MPGGNKRAYIFKKNLQLKVAGLFKCVRHFGTSWPENWLKRSKETYQNQSQHVLKI